MAALTTIGTSTAGEEIDLIASGTTRVKVEAGLCLWTDERLG